MKVSELEGAELDYWVAKSLGWRTGRLGTQSKIDPVDRGWFGDGAGRYGFPIKEFNPSSNWQYGGPLIEKYGICLYYSKGSLSTDSDGDWGADIVKHHEKSFSFVFGGSSRGITPLIAAMRCLVASKYGDEVNETENES